MFKYPKTKKDSFKTGINDFLNKKWLQSLKTFHNSSVNEDDKLLVARIVEKTIFSRIIELVENVYDPFSTKQTKNLTSLIKLILNEYPSLNVESNANTKVKLIFFFLHFKFYFSLFSNKEIIRFS